MSAAAPRAADGSAIAPALAPLTGLRGLAAVWVVLSHCSVFFDGAQVAWGGAGRWLQLGWVGVLVFFVLSGFLLASPYVDSARAGTPRPPTGPYLVRRVFRVFPAYLAQFCVLALIGWWWGGSYEVHGWRSFLAHLGMWFNLGDVPVRPLVGVWWTLPVEFAFYLVLPLLAPLFRWPVGASLILLVGALASAGLHLLAWPLPWQERGAVVTQFPGYLVLFTLGVAAAWHAESWQRYAAQRPGASHWLLSGALLLLALLLAAIPLAGGGRDYWSSPHFYFLWKPLVGVAIVGLLLSVLDPANVAARVLRSRPAIHLGEISYSIYLWHLPIVLLVASLPWLRQAGRWAPWAVALVATWLLAWAWARLFEFPGIRLGRRLAARVAGSPPVR